MNADDTPVPGAALLLLLRSLHCGPKKEGAYHDPTSSDFRKTVNRKIEVEASRQQTHPYKLGFQHSIIIIRHFGHFFHFLSVISYFKWCYYWKLKWTQNVKVVYGLLLLLLWVLWFGSASGFSQSPDSEFVYNKVIFLHNNYTVRVAPVHDTFIFPSDIFGSSNVLQSPRYVYGLVITRGGKYARAKIYNM